jgi:hypothetical protein
MVPHLERRFIMNNGKVKKLFRHDCSCCTFVGTHLSAKGKYDLYVGGVEGCYIARFSSNPGDYASYESLEELVMKINR